MRCKVLRILLTTLLFCTFTQFVKAQDKVYVGVNTGLSMGTANFSRVERGVYGYYSGAFIKQEVIEYASIINSQAGRET